MKNEISTIYYMIVKSFYSIFSFINFIEYYNCTNF